VNAWLGENDVATATMTFLEASVFEQPYKVIEINIPIRLSGRDSLH
jgi:hypothetical protein